jgi:hypothetical protein
MQEILKEMDSLIEVVQSQLPANPGSAKAEKLANALEKSMAEYFKGLEQAFPFHRLDELYYRL